MNRAWLMAGAVALCPAAAWADTIMVWPGQSIQGTVDSAPSGSTIQIAPGTYTENITLPKGKSLTIMAQNGPGTVSLNAANQSQPVFQGYGVSGMTIDGLTIKGPSQSDAIKITQAGDNFTKLSSNITITRNVINGAGLDGIKLAQTDGVTVVGNEVYNAGLVRSSDDGGEQALDFVDVTNGKVTNNIFGSTAAPTVGSSAIVLKGGTTGVQVTDNQFACQRVCISAGGWGDASRTRPDHRDYAASGLLIEHNQGQAGGAGILMAGLRYSTIRNNNITGQPPIQQTTAQAWGQGALKNGGNSVSNEKTNSTVVRGAAGVGIAATLVMSLIGTAFGQYATEPTQILNNIQLVMEVAESVKNNVYWAKSMTGTTVNTIDQLKDWTQQVRQQMGQVDTSLYDMERTVQTIQNLYGSVERGDLRGIKDSLDRITAMRAKVNDVIQEAARVDAASTDSIRWNSDRADAAVGLAMSAGNDMQVNQAQAQINRAILATLESQSAMQASLNTALLHDIADKRGEQEATGSMVRGAMASWGQTQAGGTGYNPLR